MKLKELLDSPEKWIKGAWARDRHNFTVPPRDSSATCWCLIGAIQKCYPDPDEASAVRLKILKSNQLIRLVGIANWNDSGLTKFEHVKNLIEKLDI